MGKKPNKKKLEDIRNEYKEVGGSCRDLEYKFRCSPNTVVKALKEVSEIDKLMNDIVFLRSFFNVVMADYIRYSDQCFACESDFWNAYWSIGAEDILTIHAMREGGEIISTKSWIQDFIKNFKDAGKSDWREVLKEIEKSRR
jgi:hypothetical protein